MLLLQLLLCVIIILITTTFLCGEQEPREHRADARRRRLRTGQPAGVVRVQKLAESRQVQEFYVVLVVEGNEVSAVRPRTAQGLVEGFAENKSYYRDSTSHIVVSIVL